MASTTFQRPAAAVIAAGPPPDLAQAVDALPPMMDLGGESKHDAAPVYDDDLDAPMMSRTPSKILRGPTRKVGLTAPTRSLSGSLAGPQPIRRE